MMVLSFEELTLNSNFDSDDLIIDCRLVGYRYDSSAGCAVICEDFVYRFFGFYKTRKIRLHFKSEEFSGALPFFINGFHWQELRYLMHSSGYCGEMFSSLASELTRVYGKETIVWLKIERRII